MIQNFGNCRSRELGTKLKCVLIEIQNPATVRICNNIVSIYKIAKNSVFHRFTINISCNFVSKFLKSSPIKPGDVFNGWVCLLIALLKYLKLKIEKYLSEIRSEQIDNNQK